MESFIRGVQRMGLALKNNPRIINTTRQASVAAKCKIIEGNNGERIFPSIYDDVEIPNLTIHDYIWKDVEKHSKLIALVCLEIINNN